MRVEPLSESVALLTLRNVSNTYITQAYGIFGRKHKKSVVDQVDLTLAPGELFGLVGESGCGKTSQGRCILGLIDYEGDIIIDGLRQDKRRRRELARKVQVVFQDPAGSLNPAKYIGWILEEPLRIHRIGTKAERIQKVDQVLQLVGLDPSYKTRKVHELSGGQKQRVCIGCALMLDPKLIIADEAVSSLDVSVGAQILNLFQDLHQRLGLALVFISHNLNVVYYLCDRIAVMYSGQIVELGTAEDIYSAPAHPYTRALLDAIPELSWESADKPHVELVLPVQLPLEALPGCRFSGRCPWKGAACGHSPQKLVALPGNPLHLVRCHRLGNA
ncbi:MAG: ATP-binding cassette domain-containing protein [Treponema sp.]|jgi:oligopeptide/dipeptide ABC transporter ATP-binding protein|nr:ATP-binding cassette domain-containing protein [Treponema sp.]